MSPLVRLLLWAAVVVAPGGVLLLPVLAADAWRVRAKSPPAANIPADA